MPDNQPMFDKIRAHAFQQIQAAKLGATNLYLDEHVRKAGERLGPAHQGLVLDRDSILVFVDDFPQANFGHSCRYFLYDPKTGDPRRKIDARFPPVVEKGSQPLKPFHQPVRYLANAPLYNIQPILPCPIFIYPEGTRYAILFSGNSNFRHLNDLEFLYRTLIDKYAFDAKQIYVLNYDGSLATQDGVPTSWPGDGTAYRIQVTGPGTRAGFEAAIDSLKKRIGKSDVLVIHTNNHGDNQGAGKSAICTYPSYDDYFCTDFANKLGELPQYRSLMVSMEQCYSGGFKAPVLAKSTADNTSIACAVTEFNVSWGTPDLNWDYFARDWIASEAGHYPDGSALASNPDTDGDGRIEAEEAFAYAQSVAYSGDSPNYDENNEAGGDIWLGQDYVIWWWWCRIILPVLARYYPLLPIQEYSTLIHRAGPELVKIANDLDSKSEALRKEFEPKVRAAITATFGSAKR